LPGQQRKNHPHLRSIVDRVLADMRETKHPLAGV
jgi:hypothetical protein